MPLPNTSFAVTHHSVKEQLYDAIKDWIIDGTLRPGEKISDADIAGHFNVSRTPVREVFQMLSAQKLIEVIPCKATVIAPLNTKNIEEYYLPLNALLALAASLAASNILPSQLVGLEEIEAALEENMGKGNLLEAFHLDQKFHREILKIAGNPYITDFVETLLLHVSRLEYLYFKHSSEIKLSFAEHHEIIHALRCKNAKLAADATHQNWERSMHQIRTIIQGGACHGNHANT